MIADAICRTIDREVPIVAGAHMPLQPIPIYPTPKGTEALMRWQHKKYSYGDAISFIYNAIKDNPNEITLIGIGNMTSIAMLSNQHPDSIAMLDELYVMNGYFGMLSLPEAYYNCNSWADSLASKVVFASKVKTHRAITIGITEKLTLYGCKCFQ